MSEGGQGGGTHPKKTKRKGAIALRQAPFPSHTRAPPKNIWYARPGRPQALACGSEPTSQPTNKQQHLGCSLSFFPNQEAAATPQKVNRPPREKQKKFNRSMVCPFYLKTTGRAAMFVCTHIVHAHPHANTQRVRKENQGREVLQL